MKLIKFHLILIPLLLGLIKQPDAQAQYRVQKSVFGNGGSVIYNDSYNIGSTIGQPVIGAADGPSYNNKIGFWYLFKGFLTGVEQMVETLPKRYWLGQNYPNPFNSSTTITYDLPEKALVELKIFDTLGREMRTLLNESKDAGEHQINLDLQNYTSGIYFFQIKANTFIKTKRLILIK